MIEVALEYACQCRDTWHVSQLPASEPQVMLSNYPCVPETCDTCLDRGHICSARSNLDARMKYTPIQFEDIKPLPHKRRPRRHPELPSGLALE